MSVDNVHVTIDPLPDVKVTVTGPPGPPGSGSGGGVTDHGALTGLTDDDHPQYAKTSHTHTLDNLSDVTTSGATNGMSLVYNSGNWTPATVTSGGGVTDHTLLTGRSTADGHPIGAITNLQTTLNGKAALSHTHALADLPSTVATDAEVTTAISTHASAADPHTGYLKPTDVVAGTNITLTRTADTVTISSTSTGGGGVGGYVQKVAPVSYWWWAGNTGEGADWGRMAAAVPNQEFAICNPNSGVGAAINNDWVTRIQQAQAAGLKVYGYVSTDYAGTVSWGEDPLATPASIKAEVDSYYSWYNVDGIFYDESSWQEELVPWYKDIYDYVKAKTGVRGKTVIINPGSYGIHENYMTVCDHIMTYENTAAEYLTTVFPTWMANYAESRFWHSIHTVTSTSQAQQVLDKSLVNRAGYVYLSTSPLDPNPWDGLPDEPYWSMQVNHVAQTGTGEGGGGGHAIQDEGLAKPARAALNFAGAGVTVTDDSANDRTTVTIPGGGGGGMTQAEADARYLQNEVPDTMNGTLSVNGAVNVNAPAGTGQHFGVQAGGKTRWAIGRDNAAESTGNAGSNFAIARYADDGTTWLGNAMTVNRATGAIALEGQTLIPNASQLVTPLTVNRSAVSTSTSDADIFAVNYGGTRSTWVNEKGQLRTSNAVAKAESAFKIIGASQVEGGTGNMMEVLDIAGNVQTRIGPLGRQNFNKGIRMVGDTIQVRDSTEVDESTISQPLGGSLTIAPKTSLSLSSKKIVSVADPTAAQDVATKNYVDTRAPKITASLTAPATPAVNDVWIDLN